MRRPLCGVVVVGALVFAPTALGAGAGFGVQNFEVSATVKPTAEQQAKHERGVPDVQAGSHPYALTTTIVFNESELNRGKEPFVATGGSLKDVQVQLPPGFVGNPNAVPKCSYDDFIIEKCPDDTAVGEETTGLGSSTGEVSPRTHQLIDQVMYLTNAVYNVEPPGGVAAELGFRPGGGSKPILLDASVRTGGDYGITVGVHSVTQAIVPVFSRVTIWGVPADPSHDRLRGKCLSENSQSLTAETEGQHNEEESHREEQEEKGEPLTAPASCPVSIPVEPFLTNPTSCGQPREVKLSVDDWNEPGNFLTGEHIISTSAALPALSGCERLDFSPTLSVTPDGSAGSTPTGLNVDVHVPQESTTNPVGLGEADVRNTTVTLPEGMQISPSAADGLQACAQLHGREPGKEERERKREEVGINLESAAPANCPDASKIATVHIKTPILEHELEGAVYLASPQNFVGPPENPFGSLIAMYLIAEEPQTRVLVKLAGKVVLNPTTSQLTSTFENTPQAPVEDIKLAFFGTDRAPLATPALCGSYTTTAQIAPWSGAPAVSPSSSFQITSGPEVQTASGPQTTPCSNPLPFSPSLVSDTTNIQAGAFTPLTTTLSREDGQQDIQQVTLHFPPGLSGILAGVKLCGEGQANAGTCGPESEIGETIVSVGLGNDPFTVTGGKVYITEKYEGAPFGLSIVNPAKAGPFVLEEGRPVVVRGKLELDPYTTALTFTSNTEAQGHAIPHIIDGIPLQIKHVNVTINRPGFTFNPTNCNRMAVGGNVGSDSGASAPVAVPFQVTNCAALGFAPKFTVSTSAKASRTNGASLNVKLAYPAGSFGSQANIGEAAVKLPKQLPARLKTLQKACTAAQFEANPAGCPAASVVGHAKVITPLLPVPLEGPAYFVSYGGEAFPSLIVVLQGYGLTVDLVGATFIDKHNVTSSTFKTVPDQPFSIFELTLPGGPYSALATDGSLCKSTLMMPTTFIAQNGTEINRATKIKVTDCHKRKTKPKRTAKKTGEHKK